MPQPFKSATVTSHATTEGNPMKPITRAYIRSLRGSLKGQGVLKSLIASRKRERGG